MRQRMGVALFQPSVCHGLQVSAVSPANATGENVLVLTLPGRYWDFEHIPAR